MTTLASTQGCRCDGISAAPPLAAPIICAQFVGAEHPIVSPIDINRSFRLGETCVNRSPLCRLVQIFPCSFVQVERKQNITNNTTAATLNSSFIPYIGFTAEPVTTSTLATAHTANRPTQTVVRRVGGWCPLLHLVLRRAVFYCRRNNAYIVILIYVVKIYISSCTRGTIKGQFYGISALVLSG
eukprot:GHVS01041178.1.p1 GENE.GHVS01041178.1~~GHVS01041178.1.p1  ORF type:complete len:184 (-),score=22.35 GHVS01041178.1:368-919(-)